MYNCPVSVFRRNGSDEQSLEVCRPGDEDDILWMVTVTMKEATTITARVMNKTTITTWEMAGTAIATQVMIKTAMMEAAMTSQTWS